MLTREQEAEAQALAEGRELPLTPQRAQEYLDTVEWAERESRRIDATVEREMARAVSPEARSEIHRAKAAQVAAIRGKLAVSAQGHQERAAKVVAEYRDQRIPDEQYGRFLRDVGNLTEELDAVEKLATAERRHNALAAVSHEPGPYDEGSPNSWVRDVLVAREAQAGGDISDLVKRSSPVDMSLSAVNDRLARHAQDVRGALRLADYGHSYGKRARQTLREANRQQDEELNKRLADEEVRALTTGGGATASASGGQAAAFVSPAVLIDHIWAQYRSPYRAFADQCNSSVSLPDYGLTAYVPTFTSGTTVATQVEGAAVSEGVPVTAYTSSPIVLKAGQIEVTQQWLDRAGPGIAGDKVLFEQLREQLDAQIDAYAISQAIAGAQAVTNNGSFALTGTSGVGGAQADIKSAKNKLHDTAGVRIRATHIFASGDWVDYVSAYADAQGRPVFSPAFDDNRLPIRSTGDQVAEGYSGYVLVGCALFADDNIPAVGTTGQTQLVVCRPETILQLEGPPIPYCYPPSVAGSLTAILGLRGYTATVARFKEGVSTITGKAYEASNFS